MDGFTRTSWDSDQIPASRITIRQGKIVHVEENTTMPRFVFMTKDRVVIEPVVEKKKKSHKKRRPGPLAMEKYKEQQRQITFQQKKKKLPGKAKQSEKEKLDIAPAAKEVEPRGGLMQFNVGDFMDMCCPDSLRVLEEADWSLIPQ